jgi:membrane protease YdiL (CAAX protease family)
MEPLTSDNPWVLSVTRARRHAGAPITIAIAALSLFLALIVAPYAHRMLAGQYPPGSLSAGLSQIFLYAGIFLPLYLAPFALRTWEEWGPRAPALSGWQRASIGLAIGAFAFLFTVLAVSVAGVVQQAGPGGFGPGVVFAALLTAFQAFGEEFFFRGWLQPIFAHRWGLRTGLVSTALLFALSHWVVAPLSALATLNIFIAGLFFGLLALRTGGLAAPFAAHWVWNWLEQSVMGLVPNPGVSSFGSAFDFDLVGPQLLSGGADGLDGSIIVTVVLSACVAGLVMANSSTRAAADSSVAAVNLAQRHKPSRDRAITR